MRRELFELVICAEMHLPSPGNYSSMPTGKPYPPGICKEMVPPVVEPSLTKSPSPFYISYNEDSYPLPVPKNTANWPEKKGKKRERSIRDTEEVSISISKVAPRSTTSSNLSALSKSRKSKKSEKSGKSRKAKNNKETNISKEGKIKKKLTNKADPNKQPKLSRKSSSPPTNLTNILKKIPIRKKSTISTSKSRSPSFKSITCSKADKHLAAEERRLDSRDKINKKSSLGASRSRPSNPSNVNGVIGGMPTRPQSSLSTMYQHPLLTLTHMDNSFGGKGGDEMKDEGKEGVRERIGRVRNGCEGMVRRIRRELKGMDKRMEYDMTRLTHSIHSIYTHSAQSLHDRIFTLTALIDRIKSIQGELNGNDWNGIDEIDRIVEMVEREGNNGEWDVEGRMPRLKIVNEVEEEGRVVVEGREEREGNKENRVYSFCDNRNMTSSHQKELFGTPAAKETIAKSTYKDLTLQPTPTLHHSKSTQTTPIPSIQPILLSLLTPTLPQSLSPLQSSLNSLQSALLSSEPLFIESSLRSVVSQGCCLVMTAHKWIEDIQRIAQSVDRAVDNNKEIMDRVKDMVRCAKIIVSPECEQPVTMYMRKGELRKCLGLVEESLQRYELPNIDTKLRFVLPEELSGVVPQVVQPVGVQSKQEKVGGVKEEKEQSQCNPELGQPIQLVNMNSVSRPSAKVIASLHSSSQSSAKGTRGGLLNTSPQSRLLFDTTLDNNNAHRHPIHRNNSMHRYS